MIYQKIKNKYLCFSILGVLVCGCSFFSFPFGVNAKSLGNCDASRMTTSEYEDCVEKETCESDEYMDSSGNCVKYSTDSGYFGSDSQGNAVQDPGTKSSANTSGAIQGTNYYTSNPTASSYYSTSGSGWDPGSLSQFSLPSGSVYLIVRNVLNWILLIFGLLAVIGFAISGIMYIISIGDDDAMQRAKKAMTYSIIGVVVAMSGLVIIYAIDKMLRGYTYF